MRKPTALLGVVLALLLPGPAAADSIYRWQDAQGRVHYGDEPPAEHASEELDAGLLSRNVVRMPEPQSRRRAASRRAADVTPVAESTDCDGLDQELREIRTRLRAGYTIAEGARLEARQRDLRWQRLRECG
jgi:hypothetical protein